MSDLTKLGNRAKYLSLDDMPQQFKEVIILFFVLERRGLLVPRDKHTLDKNSPHWHNLVIDYMINSIMPPLRLEKEIRWYLNMVKIRK